MREGHCVLPVQMPLLEKQESQQQGGVPPPGMLPIGAALDCAPDVVCPGRGFTGPYLPVLQEPLSLLTLCFVTATHPCVAGEVPLRKRASALVGISERPLLALRT